jgi:hypothetical protein
MSPHFGTEIWLSEQDGWYHVCCGAEWPTAEKTLAEVARVLHGFADGRKAYIRRAPKIASEKDFDSKIVRHRASTRFSFRTEPGEWTYPEPETRHQLVGFGLSVEATR